MAIGQYVTLPALKLRLGVTDAVDDALLQRLVDLTNDWVERTIGRPVAPVDATTITLDGDAASADGRTLFVPLGIRALTTLEIATQTGGAYETVPAAEYVLRPPAWQRLTNEPATQIVLLETASRRFGPGTDVVRLTGTFGWAAVPDDLAAVAEVVAARAWRSRTGTNELTATHEGAWPQAIAWWTTRGETDVLRRYRIRRIG